MYARCAVEEMQSMAVKRCPHLLDSQMQLQVRENFSDEVNGRQRSKSNSVAEWFQFCV